MTNTATYSYLPLKLHQRMTCRRWNMTQQPPQTSIGPICQHHHLFPLLKSCSQLFNQSSLQSSTYSCRNPVDSGRFREFRGMEILAVLPAKIGISVPRNSGGFRNGPGITKTESTGMESPEFFLIVIVIFKSNTNYLIVITVN